MPKYKSIGLQKIKDHLHNTNTETVPSKMIKYKSSGKRDILGRTKKDSLFNKRRNRLQAQYL